MGEAIRLPFKPVFNGSVSVEARPERLTAESGALLLREIDERLGVTRWLAGRLEDPRNQALITHPFEELLRTSNQRPDDLFLDDFFLLANWSAEMMPAEDLDATPRASAFPPTKPPCY